MHTHSQQCRRFIRDARLPVDDCHRARDRVCRMNPADESLQHQSHTDHNCRVRIGRKDVQFQSTVGYAGRMEEGPVVGKGG